MSSHQCDELSALRERIAELEADNARLRVMVLAGGGVSETQARLARLEAENAKLRASYTEEVERYFSRLDALEVDNARLEADNARLTAELADVHALDEFSRRDKRLYAAHPVVKMNGYWSVVIGPGKDFTAGTASEARRAAIEWLRANQKEER